MYLLIDLSDIIIKDLGKANFTIMCKTDMISGILLLIIIADIYSMLTI